MCTSERLALKNKSAPLGFFPDEGLFKGAYASRQGRNLVVLYGKIFWSSATGLNCEGNFSKVILPHKGTGCLVVPCGKYFDIYILVFKDELLDL